MYGMFCNTGLVGLVCAVGLVGLVSLVDLVVWLVWWHGWCVGSGLGEPFRIKLLMGFQFRGIFVCRALKL